MADETRTTPETTAVYPTRAEAEAHKPEGGSKHLRVYEVYQHGTTKGFIWCSGYANGLSLLARRDGYTVSSGKGAVTKEKVAKKLAEFSDSDLAELGLVRKSVKAKK